MRKAPPSSREGSETRREAEAGVQALGAGAGSSVWSWGSENLVATGLLSPTPASLPSAILTLVNAPYKRGFYCGDYSIRYPYRPDTITHGLMAGVIITTTIILVRQEGRGGRRAGALAGRVLPGVVSAGERAPLEFPAPQ